MKKIRKIFVTILLIVIAFVLPLFVPKVVKLTSIDDEVNPVIKNESDDQKDIILPSSKTEPITKEETNSDSIPKNEVIEPIIINDNKEQINVELNKEEVKVIEKKIEPNVEIQRQSKIVISTSDQEITNTGMVITINASETDQISFNGSDYTFDKKITVRENGSYNINIKDQNGKIKELILNVTNIDKTKPTLDYRQDITDITEGNVTIYLTSSDNVSLPIDKYSYNYGEFTSNDSYTFESNFNNFSIRVKDTAGNITEKLITINNINKEKTLREKNIELISQIRTNYGFDIDYGKDTYFWFNGQSCQILEDENKVNIALNKLNKKIQLFPPGFFYMFQDKNGYSLLLVDDIPGDVAGVATNEMPGDNQLVLDVNAAFLERTFFHETFHIIDYLIDYMYYNRSDHPFNNWSSLNDPTFTYSGSDYDDNALTIYDSNITNIEKTFVTAYSKKSDREDRAELFADLMFRPYKQFYMNDNYGVYNKAKYLVNVLNSIWTNNSEAGWNRWIN